MTKAEIEVLQTFTIVVCAVAILALAGVGAAVVFGKVEATSKPPLYTEFQLGSLPDSKEPSKEWSGSASIYAGDKRIPPPGKLQSDARVVVEFIAPEKIEAECKGSAFACANEYQKMIWMPNPCVFAETDGYANVLCHELGHINGWDHPGISDSETFQDVGRWISSELYSVGREIHLHGGEIVRELRKSHKEKKRARP